MLTWLTKMLFESGSDVLKIFKLIGFSYGVVILLLALSIKEPGLPNSVTGKPTGKFFSGGQFYKLLAGIFCGTFAGLLVIGNLKPLGAIYDINNDSLLLGITLFSLANFTGRLFWGWLSDYFNGSISIFLALSLLGIFVFLIGYMPLTAVSYLLLSAGIGFGFGANFVLFARETATFYGANNLGYVYPYIFLGYGISGIIGPVTGGLIFDLSGSYSLAAYIAAILSITGAIVFLFNFRKNLKVQLERTLQKIKQAI